MSYSSFNPAMVSGTGTVIVTKDEGTIVEALTGAFNFVGPGVTATKPSPGNVTVTVPGGGGATGTVVNVLDYGAVADCVTLFDITMPNGNVVTSASRTFVAGDIGKWAIIRGATNSVTGLSPLIAQITAVSGHTATLNASTNSALTNVTGSSFPRMDFGTDNTWPFDLACFAIPGPGQRNHDFSTPFATSGTMNPILPGDGGTVFIPKGNYLLVTAYPFVPGTTYWFFEQNCITIKGEGIGATNLFVTSVTNASPCLSGGYAGNHGYFQNVTFQDFTMFDLNYMGGNGNTLNVWQTNNLRIERIEIYSGKGNACINVEGVRNVTTGITIRNCWIHGSFVDGYNGSGGFSFGIQGDGINAGELRDVHIENNRIEGTGRHAYEGGGVCSDQWFIGNNIDMKSAGNSGINPTGGNRTVVIGNDIRNVGPLDNFAAFAIDFTCDVGSPFTCNDNIVMGNRCHGQGQALIRFQNTSSDTSVNHVNNFTIIGNQLTGTGTNSSGILLGGGSGAFEFPNALITGNIYAGTSNFLAVVNSFTGTLQADRRLVITNNIIANGALSVPVAAGAFTNQTVIDRNIINHTAANASYGSAQTNNLSGAVGAGLNINAIRTMTGARPGVHRVVMVNGNGQPPGLISWGTVTANDQVTIYYYNPTAGSLTSVDGKFYLEMAPQ